MIVIFYCLVGAGAIVFQSTVSEYFKAWLGARPDAMTLIVVYLGLQRGQETGLIGGFFLGLLQDVLTGGLLGANALSKGLIGHATGSLRRNVSGREALFHALLAFFASVFNSTLMVTLLFVFLPDVQIHPQYWLEAGKTTLLNTFLAPLLVGLLVGAEERIFPAAAGTPYPERS
ncbi:MAG: rod shape-determining protein MreD [Candidatus Tectomicrobia bacterium RIFCSPLOWO2_12_FULL_69_37]|nr:MAG: rod shape-determining protein MreD [Candidatus Tectomicrobia bacterium RIFCSPLOWO2_02_FULL_70_19]OGL66651.1 MAG: rod shape-determining protein MreD [Candidatus Tectomicrobia bacterium RIFCSPLOWO2_12_FULL_69_37]